MITCNYDGPKCPPGHYRAFPQCLTHDSPLRTSESLLITATKFIPISASGSLYLIRSTPHYIIMGQLLSFCCPWPLRFIRVRYWMPREPGRPSMPTDPRAILLKSLPPSLSPWSRVSFVSLGMTILDDIHYLGRDEGLEVPGGPGLWATFGARLFKDGFSSKEVGCLLIPRTDFPPALLETLRSWDMTLVVRESLYRACTRAQLTYYNPYAFDGKVFTCLNDKLRPRIWDLDHSDLLGARSFHFASLPNELRQQLSNLDYLRRQNGLFHERLIAWEPASEACNRTHLDDILRMMPLVDIFSPSHDELINMTVNHNGPPWPFSPQTIQEQSRRFIEAGIGPRGKGVLIVRCGLHGYFYMKSENEKGWARPWHSQPHQDPAAEGGWAVKDVTGSGSAFLGAFTVYYEASGDVKMSCLRGMMAASFAMMQFGLPQRADKNMARVEDEVGPFSYETWNNRNPFLRLCQKERDETIFYQRPN
ncbi:Ribokinase-like protein [Xylaria venustula]|nr:Ribokinase-like protein [Xylaria venustula]